LETGIRLNNEEKSVFCGLFLLIFLNATMQSGNIKSFALVFEKKSL